MMRGMLRPKCCSKVESSAAMIAWRRFGEIASYGTTSRRWMANSPMTSPRDPYTREMVLGA